MKVVSTKNQKPEQNKNRNKNRGQSALLPNHQGNRREQNRPFFGILLAAVAVSAAAASGLDSAASEGVALSRTVTRLDAGLFDAFNHCDTPGELQKHAGYLARDLEFYHDKGGVTWTRAAYLANTEKNVCGHFRRELVTGSLEVFPIKDFGAIEQGGTSSAT
ncbi:nuclear transport factor 2 family protein [Rhodanobacter sp. FDAARGOS 1247]|uniref:DUF4440 domain-containing protein n=1 Tax=Rhodanobacter sp. FDAARGOS 1247 TaxID=2778082 RepID=UPI001950EB6C|nr:DUF4440 domain-containing protein [Rhodanobacter sp. FDAARGOS 1247]QRP63516.1 nuclear transport factor 2 family protein [Rhodanobacter sp. FDAARGOS 1247]